jgi:hypothetical protein
MAWAGGSPHWILPLLVKFRHTRTLDMTVDAPVPCSLVTYLADSFEGQPRDCLLHLGPTQVEVADRFLLEDFVRKVTDGRLHPLRPGLSPSRRRG